MSESGTAIGPREMDDPPHPVLFDDALQTRLSAGSVLRNSEIGHWSSTTFSLILRVTAHVEVPEGNSDIQFWDGGTVWITGFAPCAPACRSSISSLNKVRMPG